MDNPLFSPLEILKRVASDTKSLALPSLDIASCATDMVIPFVLVKGTRGYIEKLVHQINGCYKNAWYDACAVIIRRLAEVLIIEVYERHELIAEITDSTRGSVFMLDGLISTLLAQTRWKLGRNTEKGLPLIKQLGDKSAHNRRYNAIRNDIDKCQGYLRDIVDELLHLAQLK